IAMFHRVRPGADDAAGFAPNRGLEIEPAFFDATLRVLREEGFDLVTLDEALARLRRGAGGRPFAALTFDDGTRDTLTCALPILERHEAPFVVYAVPGFLDRTAPAWWMETERAVAERADLTLTLGGATERFAARTPREKRAAHAAILRAVADAPGADVFAALGLSREGAAWRREIAEEFMDEAELRALAGHPLATIGAHTMTHPRLSRLSADDARAEMEGSRRDLERRFGREVAHFAYPVGDRGSAGAREFALARDIGFSSATTTRKGMLFDGHAGRLHALPRLSVNGHWQDERALRALLTGAPFALARGFRRLDVD
ncbi:MAG: polysaccharide deacetylase family protein, partial [Hyphomicrobiales bacterium]|nr:polysaccharide deacetylase family protein [Hyphomicrobiales bacterium]